MNDTKMEENNVDAEMSSAEEELEVESPEERKEFVNKLMKDPQVLAALQTKLRRFLGTPSSYIASLPNVIKQRIKALKKLQLEFSHLDAQFYKEVHELEVKYDKLHQRLYEKRREILGGEYEPNEEECNFPSDSEEDEDENDDDEKKLCKDLEKKTKVEESENKKNLHNYDENTKGIPDFWLTIFKNVDLLSEMLQDYDEPILSYLDDIKVKFHDEPMGFTLEFHFRENEHFTNKVLTKYYEMKCEPDTDDPFSFEGPEIIKCKGCSIDWKKGKNITVKTIKKKQKHKSRGSIRTVTKTVQNDSFFNFFNPAAVPDDPEEEMDEDTQALLTSDFEIGHYIRERIVPRAVLFFTGEALDDEDYEDEGEEEDEDEDEEEDEDEDENDDPDYDPSKDKSGKDQSADCKQQ